MASLQFTSLISLAAEISNSTREVYELVLEWFKEKSTPYSREGEEDIKVEEEGMESVIEIPMYQREENEVDFRKNNDTFTSKDCGEQTRDGHNMKWNFAFKIKYMKGNSFQPKYRFWKKKTVREGANYCIDCLCSTGQELANRARPRKRKKKRER